VGERGEDGLGDNGDICGDDLSTHAITQNRHKKKEEEEKEINK
jgi:hypothetical protein